MKLIGMIIGLLILVATIMIIKHTIITSVTVFAWIPVTALTVFGAAVAMIILLTMIKQ